MNGSHMMCEKIKIKPGIINKNLSKGGKLRINTKKSLKI